MLVQETAIPGVLKITPRRFGDERGFFSELYNGEALRHHGVTTSFIQDNHAFNNQRGIVRGLHFQRAPHAQTKLVRCIRGAILDVAVDIRHASPTFGQHVSAVLSDDNWEQLLIPKGFAHGYLTLTDEAVVQYKVDHAYAPRHEGGIVWDDPDLAIDWGVAASSDILIADKDRRLPRLRDLAEQFA